MARRRPVRSPQPSAPGRATRSRTVPSPVRAAQIAPTTNGTEKDYRPVQSGFGFLFTKASMPAWASSRWIAPAMNSVA